MHGSVYHLALYISMCTFVYAQRCTTSFQANMLLLYSVNASIHDISACTPQTAVSEMVLRKPPEAPKIQHRMAFSINYINRLTNWSRIYRASRDESVLREYRSRETIERGVSSSQPKVWQNSRSTQRSFELTIILSKNKPTRDKHREKNTTSKTHSTFEHAQETNHNRSR